MTHAQIARALREAAMWAQYSGYCPSPLFAINMSTWDDGLEKWLSAESAFLRMFANRKGWTRKTTILALLFAAEAVEGEG